MTRIRVLLVALLVALTAAVGAAPASALPHTNEYDSPAELGREFVAQERGLLPFAQNAQRGCVTRFQTRNFSSRNGVKPRMNVGHFTVSKNVPGTADVDGIWDFFNRDGTNASSTYIIDAEGNCIYAVPESMKPWTQGAFNPWSISVEFIAVGDESRAWWNNKGLRKMALVFHDAAKRWGIPLRLVDPVGCTPIAGITDHDRLECGNTHWDLGPNFPWKLFLRLVKNAGQEPPKFNVTVNPLGKAGASVVWKGVKVPQRVTVAKTGTAAKPWRVVVGKKPVWAGKFYPEAVRVGRVG